MLYSKLFGKSTKKPPQKTEAKNHELLTQAGFIDQVASGIYNLLPLGWLVVYKIENIIREEMEKIDAQEILMPLLHPKNLWETTNRWQTVDVLFKTKSRFGQEYALAPTHEETIVPLAKKWIKSYRDLPLALFHITEKFRDEPRPKSGILRGREFRMKDLYSFHATYNDLCLYYQKVISAYLRIFSRCGLSEVKITEASGGTFTKKYSHEFNILTPAGEVDLIYCPKCNFAQNKEISQYKEEDPCPKCGYKGLKSSKAIEIGNIFDLGTRFSKAFDLKFVDKDGQKKLCFMGCYGIGTTRLMGAVVEVFHDEKGIIWPENIAPYQVILVGLDLEKELVRKFAEKVYHFLKEKKVSVLFDDRMDISPGEKLVNADLLGIPYRLVISKKTGEKIEVKKRSEDSAKLISLSELFFEIKNNP